MNVSPINNSQQNFKALDFRHVSTADRVFVQKEFKELKELGEKYDIQMVSTYVGFPNFSGIDIIVKPLAKDLKLLRRLFTPKGNSTYHTGYLSLARTGESSVVDSVRDAIRDLNSKLH